MNSIKKDNLDALILLSAHVLTEKNAKDFFMTDTSDAQRPRSLDRKIERMIRREEQRRNRGFFFATKRAAVIFLAVCMVAAIAAMSVDSVRLMFWQTIIKQYDQYIDITYETNEDVPTVIETKYEPMFVPEGWTKCVFKDSKGMRVIRYYKNEEPMMIFKQFLMDARHHIDNSDATVQTVTVGDHEGTLICQADEGTYQLEWNDGKYAYGLSTSAREIGSELVLAIAESVAEIKEQ